jgi:AcrR family transcriptional regulator
LTNTNTLATVRTLRTLSHSSWGDQNDLLRVVPKQKKSRRLVDSILAAARSVAMNASEPLTTTKIAEVAECSVAAVYRYFGDVHEIRAALVAQDWSNYVEAALLYELNHSIRTPSDILDMHFALREASLRGRSGPIPTVKRYDSTNSPTESELIARLHLLMIHPPQIGIDRSSLLWQLELIVRLADALILRAFAASPAGDPQALQAGKSALLGYIASRSSYKTSHRLDAHSPA